MFLKLNHGKFSLNIPLFKDPEMGPHYIIIGISTLTPAEKIIDEIIDKNYGKSYFTSLKIVMVGVMFIKINFSLLDL